MTTMCRWTGREAKLLREALRLSVRDFADRLGVGARTVNKWEARLAGITPLPYMQEVLDTALARASDEVKARFAAATRTELPEHDTAHLSPPGESLSGGLPVRKVTLPVVVNGHPVLVPIDADTVTALGLDTAVTRLNAVTDPTGDVRGNSDGSPAEDGDLALFSPDSDVVSAATVESSDEPGEASDTDAGKVDAVLRRDFSGGIAAIALGMGINALDLDRLIALVDRIRRRPPRRIGAADVEAIEQATAVLRRWLHSSGGGMSWSIATAQLRSVLPLLGATSPPEVRERLLVATADLGKVAAFATYDAERHHDARLLWPIALSVARQAQTSRATDLAVHLLLSMSHQALHLGKPQEASGFVQLGYGIAASRSHTLAAATASCLAGYQAMCHGAQGHVEACDRAVNQAAEHFAHADPATAAPWFSYVTAANLAAKQGHARYSLALTTADTTHAARAVPVLQQAVNGHGPAYARARAVNLANLSGAHALIGDLVAAVHIGHQAVEEITALASRQAYDRLRTLDTVLRPHSTNAAVSEVRDRIRTTLTAA